MGFVEDNKSLRTKYFGLVKCTFRYKIKAIFNVLKQIPKETKRGKVLQGLG